MKSASNIFLGLALAAGSGAAVLTGATDSVLVTLAGGADLFTELTGAAFG